MRILVISNMYPSNKVPNYGTFVKNFCNQLDELNINYKKVVMTKDSNKIFSYLFYYIKICFHVLFSKYDYVYVHYASHNALPLLLLKKIKNFHVFTNVHGGDVVPQTSMQRKMQKYTMELLEISRKVIVPSLYFKNLMIAKYNISQEKITIYPSSGVNNKVFFPYSVDQKQNIHFDNINKNSNISYIGFVSRIESGKGWDTFLNAISLLKEKGFLLNKKVIIVGNGKEYDQFVELITNLDLSKHIILFQSLPQEKLADIYNILSVFCFPTEREGESLGLVGLEALACGVPVIASNFAAPKDYIIDNYNGFKFEKGNSAELAKKLEEYFDLSIEERRKISQNAYLSCADYFSETLKEKLKLILDNA